MGEVVRFVMARGRGHVFTAADGSTLLVYEPSSPARICDGWQVHEFSPSGDSGAFLGVAPSWFEALGYVRFAFGPSAPAVRSCFGGAGGDAPRIA